MDTSSVRGPKLANPSGNTQKKMTPINCLGLPVEIEGLRWPLFLGSHGNGFHQV